MSVMAPYMGSDYCLGDGDGGAFPAFNSRIIRTVELAVDPMEPPKLRHKRIPKASASPPVPVMHSPPRPVTVKDQQDWKIPPSISNWKNAKGYTIPLDKRRVLQEVRISDRFPELSEALYVAEQKAREAVAARSELQKAVMMKEKEKKEMEFRKLAEKARSERLTREEREGQQRDAVREERHKKRRQEAKDDASSMGKRTKISRERAALGSTGTRGGEVMYDERLFNQHKGMDSGFAADDAYNIYDNRGLFTPITTLYRPNNDPFGLDTFLTELKIKEQF